MVLRTILPALFLLSLPFALPTAADEIHDAVSRGDVEAVVAIVAKDPSCLNVKNESELTPVNLAVISKEIEVLETLIRLGADLTIGDHEGSHPLHNAAAVGSMEAVEILLGEEVELSAPDDNGMTALHFAIEYRRVPIATFLIEIGADIQTRSKRGLTPLAQAVHRSQIPLAALLIDRGAQVDTRDGGGRTPLHQAAQNGDIAMVEMLLARGADLSLVDDFGRTPLFLSAFGGPAVPRLLVAQGAELPPAARGEDRLDTPLHYAVLGGNPETVAFFLEHGDYLEGRDRNGLTALHNAVVAGNVKVVETLLAAGASVAAEESGYRRTSLHLAAAAGREEIARLLLKHGADRGVSDARGETPLDLACSHGFHDLAGLIAGEKKASGLEVCCAKELLTKKIAPGRAQVVHLGHSGWAIRTAGHFLIFDYNPEGSGPDPAGASLVNGRIVADELQGQRVVVFASHEHGDHYSSRIFQWGRSLPDVRYVLGLQPPGISEEDYLYLPPRAQQDLGDLKVTTIDSNDLGVGFLVEVDGLVILHAGDHANRTTEAGPEYDEYVAEIDYLAGLGLEIDLAFYPISGCGFGNPEAVALGVGYAMKKLRPNVMCPMHAGENTYLYQEFARRFPDPSGHTTIAAAASRGDRFVYAEDTLSQ